MDEPLEIPIIEKASDVKLVVYAQSSKMKVFKENESYAGEYLMFEINSKGLEPELMHYEWNSSSIPVLSKTNRFRVSAIKLPELIKFAKKN